MVVLKGLTQAALSVMPREEIPYFENAIEWLMNPDHRQDEGMFQSVTCLVHALPTCLPVSWVLLARRVKDDAPVPYMMFFLGTGCAVFQVQVPLCIKDEDLDGEKIVVPRPTLLPGMSTCCDLQVSLLIPMSSPEPPRESLERLP
jgi:hypothetical protein